MRFGIIEGEPGIFPDPIARLLRGVGRLVRRASRGDSAPPSEVRRDGEADQHDRGGD